MRPRPLRAGWRLGPVEDGAFAARLALDDVRWFAGHYPGAPVFPGSLLIETLVQAVEAALGADLCLEEIASCRFHSPLFPGDEVTARFGLREVGASRTQVEATAVGRTLAAAVGMVVRSASAPGPAGRTAPPVPPAEVARVLDAAFILRALPHRPPALLVGEARLCEGKRPTLVAHQAITASEPCFAAGAPAGAYPAMLVVESFCQSCGLLRAGTAPGGALADQGKAPVVAKLAGLRFLGEAGPGDLLEHHVELVARTDDGAVFAGYTAVADRVVIEVKRVVAALAALSSRGDTLAP